MVDAWHKPSEWKLKNARAGNAQPVTRAGKTEHDKSCLSLTFVPDWLK